MPLMWGDNPHLAVHMVSLYSPPLGDPPRRRGRAALPSYSHTLMDSDIAIRVLRAGVVLLLLAPAGCGTTKSQLATEQMLASDAVDRSVAELNFEALAGKKVYFDTQYIRNVKGAGFVNADYIISSLRQQMFAYGCLLQENESDADIVVEGRVGVLGIDDHEITYGVPASGSLSNAASAVPGAPNMPALPELSLAKKNEQVGASKIALFAYERETRYPVWQSGVTTSMSDSNAMWLFGAGPFRRGTIYDGVQLPWLRRNEARREEQLAQGGIFWLHRRRGRRSPPQLPFMQRRRRSDDAREPSSPNALASYLDQHDFSSWPHPVDKEAEPGELPAADDAKPIKEEKRPDSKDETTQE